MSSSPISPLVTIVPRQSSLAARYTVHACAFSGFYLRARARSLGQAGQAKLHLVIEDDRMSKQGKESNLISARFQRKQSSYFNPCVFTSRFDFGLKGWTVKRASQSAERPDS